MCWICRRYDVEKKLVKSKITVQYPNCVPKIRTPGCALVDVSIHKKSWESLPCLKKNKVDVIESNVEETNDYLSVEYLGSNSTDYSTGLRRKRYTESTTRSSCILLTRSPLSGDSCISPHSNSVSAATQKVDGGGDESLNMTFVSNPKGDLSLPAGRISAKLSPAGISAKNQRNERVRFDNNVTIRTIECNKSKTVKAKSWIYRVIVLLREIWSKLDLDRDGYLNKTELNYFCSEVYDNFDLTNIMGFYAKSNQNKGMTFHEWCRLVHGEQPDISEFVEELYDIFVESSIVESVVVKVN